MWSYIGKFGIFLGGCATGGAGATAARAYERKRMLQEGEYYELQGSYYQVLGHAWDHFRRDFCVVYRPLYHCEAREGRFEAHVLATSHFQRFDNFKPVTFENMDRAAQSFALPGPFWQDKFWGFGATAPVENAEKVKELQNAFASEIRNAKTPTTSGYGTRSHQERPTERQL